jgi:hypothetical protein
LSAFRGGSLFLDLLLLFARAAFARDELLLGLGNRTLAVCAVPPALVICWR